jgi:uncharacterized damage-inducible protein DinB
MAKASAPLASLLDEALESWDFAREGVLAELANIPEKQFDFRPAPGSRSVTEIAQHIAGTGLMMVGELTRPDGSFRRRPYDRLVAEYASHVGRATTKKDLMSLLKSTHQTGRRRFGEVGELFMLQHITRFDGKPGTRLAWLHHGIGHEEYHRGQIALCARILGRVPALTKLIEGG